MRSLSRIFDETGAAQQPLTMQQLGWAAGILEGEGSFNLTTPDRAGHRTSIRIALSMTDKDIVQRFANLFGFGSICSIDMQKYRANAKRQYRWECSGRNAAALMMTIYALMGERRQQRIYQLLDYWKCTKWRARKSVPSRKHFAFA